MKRITLSPKAMDIYNAVCNVTDRMQKLGNSLKAAGNHYSDTVTSLVGNQGLAGKVERFSQLSSKAKKVMVLPLTLALQITRA